ncbi:MAG: Rieske 2Fe-2S domain-containing protein [Geminicoccaceae bacterium]|nr:Rieske 2Fe-2S domain-containing protein [Geminicoccaceae bacterium]
MGEAEREREACGCGVGRREVVLGAALLGTLPVVAAAAGNERRPKAGDVLVHSMGPKKGKPLSVEDLPPGGPGMLAFPMDPATGTVLDGSRFNEVVAVRLDPTALSEETRKGAADGVVVYSSICSHEACPVSMWNEYEHMLVCSCHGSMFDPRAKAKVVFGPAPRRLAQLPVKAEAGVLVVTGPFDGRIGAVRAA